MLINLFQTVRSAGVPCTLRELLDLLGALEKQLAYSNIDDFYYLSRAILVKDEKHYDKFDKAFDIYFKGIEKLEDIFQALIPEDWLRKAFEKELDPDELKKIQSVGGLEKLLEEFKPDIMYLSTTDYIQHKYAPGNETANKFYAMFDKYIGHLNRENVSIVITADHGMKPKSKDDGSPNAIFLQDYLDKKFEPNIAKVILPIT